MYRPVHGIEVLITLASNEGSDKSAHIHRLATAFAACIHVRIEMHIFSLHWMMQNIRLFNVCESKILHFNLYIYILYC